MSTHTVAHGFRKAWVEVVADASVVKKDEHPDEAKRRGWLAHDEIALLALSMLLDKHQTVRLAELDELVDAFVDRVDFEAFSEEAKDLDVSAWFQVVYGLRAEHLVDRQRQGYTLTEKGRGKAAEVIGRLPRGVLDSVRGCVPA